MGRWLAAALAGAVTIFVWGNVAWMVLGLHDASIRAVPDEKGLARALRNAGLETGTYLIPALPKHGPDASKDERDRLAEDFSTRHVNGPLAFLAIVKDGREPMTPGLFARAGAINLASATISATILALCAATCRAYWQRVSVVVLLAAFTAVVVHVSYWNWMFFSPDFTRDMIVDVLLGWTLVGLVQGALIRPRPASTGPVAS